MTARLNALALILPSAKKRLVMDTQPMSRLSLKRVCMLSPMMYSVLPPPMSMTMRVLSSKARLRATPR